MQKSPSLTTSKATSSTPLPSPVSGKTLCAYLSGYDPTKLSYLKRGFSEGFRLNFEGKVASYTCRNLASVNSNKAVVRDKIEKEIRTGRVAGPFDSPPFPNFRSSPIGVVPKKTPGEFRMIQDLSSPHGNSVNDGIPAEAKTVHYASIQDAITKIKALKNPVFLAKTDIKSAFRIVPVHPADYPLLGFTFEDKYYYDQVLAMGCASSCAIFEAISSAIEWIAINKLGVQAMVHVLDDFLLIVEGCNNCKTQLNLFIKFCNKTGIPLVIEKTFNPEQIMPFVGIELDTIKCESRLPEDKRQKCLAQIDSFKSRDKVQLVQLQSIIGLLNFACIVVPPGRAFLRRLCDLTIGHSNPLHHIRLSAEAKADLQVWEHFLKNFNGVSFFQSDRWTSSNTLKLHTDAAGSLGFAAIFGGHWIYGAWSTRWKEFHITFLEFYPIVAALFVWGNLWKNSNILFLCDNEAVVYIINKQSSKDKRVMVLVRKLVLRCLELNIHFKAKHVPGKYNTLPDMLSRFQVDAARRLAPWLDHSSTIIPAEISPRNLVIP
jgi:hypothetical protein